MTTDRRTKSLVFNDAVRYRDTTFDFEEHFRRALTQMGVLRDDWDPLLRRYSAFNTAIRGDSAADPAEFFDLEYLARIIRCAVKGAIPQPGANPARQLSLQPVAVGADDGGNDIG